MGNLEKITVPEWNLANGNRLLQIPLSYQVYGPKIGQAPVVVVNHALTGNSHVTGHKGWWKELIGENKTIDTNYFTVIAFNIPGNGYDGEKDNLIPNYKDFTVRDIAAIFWQGLNQLQIDRVFAVLGGSLGGAVAWAMAALRPNGVGHLIPVATDWKSTDWVIANVLVQDRILNNSDNPIADARLHAMLLYRTPESLKMKFQRQQLTDSYYIEDWLLHHGAKLEKRFFLQSYKLMNHLLKTIEVCKDNEEFIDTVKKSTASIHLIAINTDLLFVPAENKETYELLKGQKSDVFYHEIESIHGHDAFLIEYEKLAAILNPVFSKTASIPFKEDTITF